MKLWCLALWCVIFYTTVMWTSSASATCPETWIARGDSCFWASEVKKNYTESQKACQEQGARLASFSSQEEMDEIFMELHVDNEDYWFGLWNSNPADTSDDLPTRRQGWVWSNGKNVTFTNWHTDEPTGGSTCIRMVHSGKWYDKECFLEYRFFCGKDSDGTESSTTTRTTTTTLVDPGSESSSSSSEEEEEEEEEEEDKDGGKGKEVDDEDDVSTPMPGNRNVSSSPATPPGGESGQLGYLGSSSSEEDSIDEDQVVMFGAVAVGAVLVIIIVANIAVIWVIRRKWRNRSDANKSSRGVPSSFDESATYTSGEASSGRPAYDNHLGVPAVMVEENEGTSSFDPDNYARVDSFKEQARTPQTADSQPQPSISTSTAGPVYSKPIKKKVAARAWQKLSQIYSKSNKPAAANQRSNYDDTVIRTFPSTDSILQRGTSQDGASAASNQAYREDNPYQDGESVHSLTDHDGYSNLPDVRDTSSVQQDSIVDRDEEGSILTLVENEAYHRNNKM